MNNLLYTPSYKIDEGNSEKTGWTSEDALKAEHLNNIENEGIVKAVAAANDLNENKIDRKDALNMMADKNIEVVNSLQKLVEVAGNSQGNFQDYTDLSKYIDLLVNQEKAKELLKSMIRISSSSGLKDSIIMHGDRIDHWLKIFGSGDIFDNFGDFKTNGISIGANKVLSVSFDLTVTLDLPLSKNNVTVSYLGTTENEKSILGKSSSSYYRRTSSETATVSAIKRQIYDKNILVYEDTSEEVFLIKNALKTTKQITFSRQTIEETEIKVTVPIVWYPYFNFFRSIGSDNAAGLSKVLGSSTVNYFANNFSLKLYAKKYAKDTEYSLYLNNNSDYCYIGSSDDDSDEYSSNSHIFEVDSKSVTIKDYEINKINITGVQVVQNKYPTYKSFGVPKPTESDGE